MRRRVGLARHLSFDGNTITWSNGEHWIRKGRTATANALGQWWDEYEVDGWHGTWTRKGKSNQFKSLSRKEACDRADSLLEFVALADKADTPVEKLSGGMRRRLVIARALINRPDVVILDEPTTGLDPQARHLLWQRLRQLKDQVVTMVLSTHYMEEAAQLCDELVVMDQGRILAQGAPADLVSRHVSPTVLELRVPSEQPTPWLEGIKTQVERLERVGDMVYLYSHDGEELLHELRPHARSALLRPASLEDVFLILTGRNLSE